MADEVWAVRGIPEELRKTIKHYAIDNSVTVGHAVEHLILQGISAERDAALVREYFQDEAWPPMLVGSSTALLSLRAMVEEYSKRYQLSETMAVRHLLTLGIKEWQKRVVAAEQHPAINEPDDE